MVGGDAATAGLYRTLDSNHFRLLTIVAGSATKPVACRLDDHDIDAAPAYEALSYVWGDPDDRLDIQVNGQVFGITRNLYAGLLRLRFPNSNRLIWIDAVCIDQRNTQERSQQVQRMAQIYSAAAQVVVWLGEIEKAQLAFQFAEGITELGEELARSNRTTVLGLKNSEYREMNHEDIMRHLSISPPPSADECWQALGDLFAASWFERIWCFQEVVLARRASIVAGAFATTPTAVGACTLWIIAKLYGSDKQVRAFGISLGWNIWSAYARFAQPRTSLVQQRSAGSILLGILSDNRSMKALDDRDKVYAVLGVCRNLANLHEPLMVVDYDKSHIQVYVDAAWACIIHSGSLDVLSHVSHADNSELNNDVPSWTTRWNKTAKTAALEGPVVIHWSASGSSRYPMQQARIGERTLTVRGMVLETVKFVGELCPYSLPQRPQCLVQFWNVCMADYKQSIVPDPTLNSALAQVVKMANTWIGGRILPSNRFIDEADEGSMAQVCTEFLTLVDKAFALSEAQIKTIEPRKLAAFLSARGQLADTSEPAILNFEDHLWAVYNRRMVWPACASKHGFDYALAPPCTQAGDVVAILHGASLPYVLRPHADGWLLVGACYLHGVMSGELFDKQADGKTFAEEYEEREFIIY